MFTVTKDLMLPSTVTGSWPRPRWFDVCMWGRPLDTCMMDVRWREKFQDALSVVISDQLRAGLDILVTGDYHLDEDMAGRAWHHYPLQRWGGLAGDLLQPEETRSEWLKYPPGTLLYEIYTGWRWPHVVDRITDAKLDYDKMWRMCQARSSKPVKWGTCSAQVMGLFLDIHTDKYKDKREVVWDMSVAMNEELLRLQATGCECVQIEEPIIHFQADKFPEDTEFVDFAVECLNRELQGLDQMEIWVHTCWGNPNMQKVMQNNSYKNSIETYLERVNADVWTIECKDNAQCDVPHFEPFKGDMTKKIAIGAVSHRTLQADAPQDVANEIRKAMKHIRPENLVVSSDCGFGRQGFNREIAFYKASAIAQGCNIVRKELGIEPTHIPAADPQLQTDIVPYKGFKLSKKESMVETTTS